ncbi:hypothetical protein [Cohnella sp. JJ-181]|uniref:hypothetical protein n=1 Tax=Cohnella rhizoplanae TaxID=2974897 RepID=UPI0022FFA419|nr:hypothetical protein [Cohnella sp. JJ-181]CAI6081650.1 hypothetical protein COHCIP112018_03381 [Cohnella sp. JJ-181]
MTIPNQPSALSKEELEGLLGAGPKHTDGAHHPTRANQGAHAPNPRQTTDSEVKAAAGEEDTAEASQATATGQASAAAGQQADDLQMVLGHWERTVGSLQQELIELRSRVARLEQQLDEAPAHQAASRAATAGKPAPAAAPAQPDEEPPVLSRVRTYRSKRGWF